jgi:1,4-dihydroxy-2-naphthoate octaprenyltransferase
MVLGFWYNDAHGADLSCIVRNLINASGFVCFASGAMQVVIGNGEFSLGDLDWWYGAIACIVFSTVQTQNMYDQRGDAIRNRKTVPLVLGDAAARWTIAIPMFFWCWVAPWMWTSFLEGYLLLVLLGLIVALRSLKWKTEVDDKKTFVLWNTWLVSLYILPLIKTIGLAVR